MAAGAAAAALALRAAHGPLERSIITESAQGNGCMRAKDRARRRGPMHMLRLRRKVSDLRSVAGGEPWVSQPQDDFPDASFGAQFRHKTHGLLQTNRPKTAGCGTLARARAKEGATTPLCGAQAAGALRQKPRRECAIDL